MKTTLQILFAILLSTSTYAQSTVNIQINHLLDGVQFENEVNSTNDLGNDFMIDRLQYYLSGFSLVHNGGQVTEVEDLYVLVSLLESTESSVIELGEFDINNLESIRFHFGVDEQANHADPSLLHPSHALAPQFPSMHWGWAAGYRFIALEGKSGPNIDQELQFHCIGDEFYKELDFPVNMSNESEYLVSIDAEYTNLLKGIDVTGGLILHGNLGEIGTLADNLVENVFSASSTTSTEDSELVNSFEIFPNPVTNGVFTINMDVATSNNNIVIFDALGRSIYRRKQTNSTQIDITTQGMYYVSIADRSGKVLATRKVVVQ